MELEDEEGDESDPKPFWGYARMYVPRVYLPRIPKIPQPTLNWRRRFGKK